MNMGSPYWRQEPDGTNGSGDAWPPAPGQPPAQSFPPAPVRLPGPAAGGGPAHARQGGEAYGGGSQVPPAGEPGPVVPPPQSGGDPAARGRPDSRPQAHPRPQDGPGPDAWNPPPMPSRAPDSVEPLGDWLRAPRPEAGPGIWRKDHRPRPQEEPDSVGDRQLFGGALLALLLALLVWSLIMGKYLPVLDLIYGVLPVSVFAGGSMFVVTVVNYSVYLLLAMPILYVAGRAGRWPELWRRHLHPLVRKLAGTVSTTRTGKAAARSVHLANSAAGAARPAAHGPEDPASWPDVRRAGEPAAADLLAAEVRSGNMNDVDYSRIHRSWESVRAEPAGLSAFAEDVLRRGSAARPHPSGARDLPRRVARHDLLTGQVRLGAAADKKRNPYSHRGTGLALDPELLGTSLLAVGPSGTGKTSRIVRPVVETMSLQALAGRAVVVAVGADGADLGPDDAYDVVIKLGNPESHHDLDLYSGTTDPDEAAALLAEALVGDDPQTDTRRAATALAQLIGPHRAAHGRFPSVPELRELIDGVPVAVAALREACRTAESRDAGAALRELDARERQSGRPGDPGGVLADRIAFLDRPAFAGFFDTSATDPQSPGRTSVSGPAQAAADTNTGGATDMDKRAVRARPFSLRALDRPARIRVDLPERAHAEASRVLARLLLAQFTTSALARKDRSLFACLALDDAAHTLTTASVREIQRLRTAHAGVVLGLRTLEDVPEKLRAAALGAVGCRVALTGVSTWDGEVFAQSWGRDWVQTEDITHTPDFHGGLLTRWIRGVRTVFTGQRTTTKSVTVRTVQRERWSASDLANELPPEHAVLSLMTVRGDRTPPILARLGE